MGVYNKYYTEHELLDALGHYQEPVYIKGFQTIWNNNENFSTFLQPACVNCSNNPKNGGSGICNCILGQIPWK